MLKIPRHQSYYGAGKKLTQAECGVDDRTIRRIESQDEVFNPSYLTLVEIANGMGIKLKDLLETTI